MGNNLVQTAKNLVLECICLLQLRNAEEDWHVVLVHMPSGVVLTLLVGTPAPSICFLAVKPQHNLMGCLEITVERERCHTLYNVSGFIITW